MMKPAFAKIVTLLTVEVEGRLENANSMKVVKRGFPGPPGGMPPMMGMGGPPQKREVESHQLQFVKRGFPGPPGGMPPMMGMGGPPQKREVESHKLQFFKRFHPFPGGTPMGPAAPPSKRSINDDINNETHFLKRDGTFPEAASRRNGRSSIQKRRVDDEEPFVKRCHGGAMGGPPQKRGVDDEEPFVKRCGGGAMGGPPQKREVKEESKMVKRMSINHGARVASASGPVKRDINEDIDEEPFQKRCGGGMGGPSQKRGVDDEEPFVKRCHGGAMGGAPSKRSIDDQVNEGKGVETLVKRHAHNAGGIPS